ncbi:unnamed protein product [Phaedon cochleariae]|uniref:RING-type E3 ubiquitin transferase n=1 Tax=Phaedon cochleariae TaxID=80249 RepID=A0A9N9SKN3_PHACE|nr:unnamed protein product [Phaedon cochleariae]
MNVLESKVADILRLTQRDELFVRDIEEQMHSFLKLIGTRTYHKMNKLIPVIANLWYYFMTTLGNLQTLGEEYTGTIRVNNNGKIPPKMMQTLWLVLYVGGEPLLDRLLNYSKIHINGSSSLTMKAKSLFISCIDVFKDEKPNLKRIHTALFYMDGRYYNISNRLAGIRYVLLREWLQNNSFIRSFSFLGHITLFYILFNLVSRITFKKAEEKQGSEMILSNISRKSCVLCADNIKSACSTPCGHIFCWDCIHDSLSYQKTCPICRENVQPSRIIFLQNFA